MNEYRIDFNKKELPKEIEGLTAEQVAVVHQIIKDQRRLRLFRNQKENRAKFEGKKNRRKIANKSRARNR